MWLDNFNRSRPAAPPPEPLTCERLRGITTPTIVLGTEHGMRYSRQIVEQLARCIPGSRRLILPSATHFVSYQAPDVFNAAVLAHLDAH
jgi:pimeloyl-ACP methyl ester carboxylesterase